MVKLPISKSVLKYYEEVGYKFSYKEQAHLCYRYIPGLFERINALKEILKESDDEELNKDIQMMIDYETGAYNMFIENPDNKYVYTLDIIPYKSGYRYIFTSMTAVMEFVGKWVMDDYRIEKRLIFDNHDVNDSNYIARFTFRRGDDEIIDFQSKEFDDVFKYDPSEYGLFEERRFDNMYMNVDCPFDLGDIVMRPEAHYPVIVLSDKNILHERYDAAKNFDWTNVTEGVDVLMELDYNDALIPVLDYHDEFSIKYVRIFDLERFKDNDDFPKNFRENILYISKMVKAKFSMEKIKEEIYSMDSYRSKFCR